MITKEQIETIGKIKTFIDRFTKLSENKVDWEKVEMIETLDKLVENLKIAPESYKYASKEDLENNYYTAECPNCGWWGSSKLLDGGGEIGQTGDHFDCTCPVCNSLEIDDK